MLPGFDHPLKARQQKRIVTKSKQAGIFPDLF